MLKIQQKRKYRQRRFGNFCYLYMSYNLMDVNVIIAILMIFVCVFHLSSCLINQRNLCWALQL